MQPVLIDSGSANYRGCFERDRPALTAIRGAISLMAIGLCLLGVGCSAPTVWKAEAPSPDGHSIAIVRTVQGGGFGTANIDTTVYLKSTYYSNPPIQILGFSCEGPVPRPYVLDNVANVGGTINLRMKWLTPSHLQVTYTGHPVLYFQAVKVWGIDVSLQELPSAAITGR